ncbi:MAG: hypothetical protein A3F31_04080 [Candidatus Levybacteria bacterium RIFCSPHIGHO2_12_FULL_38_12]|nr:MAG: hypothetical protein A3F31_04080 [Candidatus Levybacteria bacterium RIFCSPHIGHO2_12_FULL_38_12]OGH34376.1 MAG: hypothetical protein A3A47_04475 [Candidatus Levybacteria bacterium RIFCSPLOWO2_01_FULL_37_20]OGH44439.1 MAG: hypothetical protein A3J14_03235 [Candidatus Levybacteria bacterium RIFCSPLOWO2_02_FULL_37_18]
MKRQRKTLVGVKKIAGLALFFLTCLLILAAISFYRIRSPKIGEAEEYSPVRLLMTARDKGKIVSLEMIVQGMAKKLVEIKNAQFPRNIGIRLIKIKFYKNQEVKMAKLKLYVDANKNQIFDKEDILLGIAYESWTKDNKDYVGFEVDKNLMISNVTGKYEKISYFMDLPEESYNYFIVSEDRAPVNKFINFAKEPKVTIENLYDLNNKATYSFRYINQELLRDLDLINQPLDEFLKGHKFFKYNEEKKSLVLGRGKYKITQTLIIPKNSPLIIEPGTTLILAPGVSFVSYSKVIADGTKEMPIRVKVDKLDKSFGVFALANEGASGSTFEYFNIDNGKDAYINGIFFSGMFSAYHNNDVIIKNSSFTFAHGDDAVNLKYSNASVYDSYFYRNHADSIDEDFMSGEIIGNTFIENNEDGIDLSGSTTIIKNNYIFRSKDKCISVGEGSRIDISNNFLEECNIGIASKDSSEAYISNSVFFKNKEVLNVYIKKPFFEGGKIVVNNSIFFQNGKNSVVTNTFPNRKSSDNSSINIYYSLLSADDKREDITTNIIRDFNLDFFRNKNWSLDNTFFVNANPVYLNEKNDFSSIGLSDYTLIDKLRYNNRH